MSQVSSCRVLLGGICAVLLQVGALCHAQDPVTETTGIATQKLLSPEAQLQQLNAFPHAEPVQFSQRAVLDHEVGLGAIKKVRGVWQFKRSERLSGELMSYDWQIIDGFSSAEVMADLLSVFVEVGGAEQIFACDGRACGSSAQWANRVFNQRLLYGSEDRQQYRVYALQRDVSYRLIAYSAYRSEGRQYLHVELLRIDR